MITRKLGAHGTETAAVGIGTWAIGGQFWAGDQPLGWGTADDEESVRALRRAFELGATLFDTSDAYGIGRSERLIATALGHYRDEITIATKWGNVYNEETTQLTGVNTSPQYLRPALTRSLQRLGTDYVDLYQLHVSDASPEEAEVLRDACEELVAEGLIRGYGWSTDDPDRAEVFARGRNCWAIQHEMNLFHDAARMLDVCQRHGVASLARSPLAMGLLTGKYDAAARFPADDIRNQAPEWLRYYRNGRPDADWLARLTAVRGVLTADGRTVAQGALCWLLARSELTIPIPGCRTREQAADNFAAAELGPLNESSMKEIARLLES